jgi:protoporphyrinogen/coproporphyrinogen III oxidase
VAILGAGVAGLTAAHFLQTHDIPFVLYEAGKQVAGLAGSIQEDGFTYDVGAHFITNRLAAAFGILPRCRTVRYYGESVFLKGRYYTYPMGLLRVPRFLMSALKSRVAGPPSAAASSAEERFAALYGQALTDEIASPLAEAWSGAPAGQLAASVADKIPLGIVHVMILRICSLLTRRAIAIGYGKEKPPSVGVWHVYPEDGLQVMCENLAASLGPAIQLESPVEAIHVENGRAVGLQVKGQQREVSAVISTIPCTAMARLIKGSSVLDYVSRFRFRPMLFVMARFRGRGLLKDVVIWVPEQQFPFFRMTEAPISMPWLAPEGKTFITVDIGCQVNDSFWNMADKHLGELCVEKMTTIIPDARSRYLGCRVIRTPIAYPVFLKSYEDERLRFQTSTGIEFLYSIGRNGEFDHLLTEDVYWRTMAKMETIVSDLTNELNSKNESAPKTYTATV